MADFELAIQIVGKHFNRGPEETVESNIKAGIHNLFVDLTANPNASKEEVRRCSIHALDMLTMIDPNAELSGYEGGEIASPIDQAAKRDNEGFRTQAEYFSGQQGGIVAFFVDSDTKKYDAQVKTPLNGRERLSSKGKHNDMFKSAAVATLASLSPNPTEMLMLSGVLMTLELAEDFEGSFEDVFNVQRELFGKLKRVYENESVKVLEASAGLYSPWFAVDDAIAKYDDQEKEDEWRMRIG